MVGAKALNASQIIRNELWWLAMNGYEVIAFKMGSDKPVVEIEQGLQEWEEGRKNGYAYQEKEVMLIWKAD